MRRKRALLLLVVLLVCSGCIPAITWLPDSSGFVYTAGRHGNQLMYFDLAKKEPQTLVEGTKCETLRPAVSPDGKRIALAKITHVRNERDTWRILIYDLTGKLVHSSKVFSESGFIEDENRLENTSEVYWNSPDFILINKVAFSTKKTISNLGNAGGFVLYDLKSDRIVTQQSGYVLSFDGKALRPDGKRFLVATSKKDKTKRLSVVDITGNARSVTMKPSPAEFEEVIGVLLLSGLANSSWRDNVAIISSYFGRLEIDTDRLEAFFKPDAAYSADLKEGIRQQADFSNGAWSLQIQCRKEQADNTSKDFGRLLLLDLREKKTQVLSEDALGAVLFPSPNGKFVAVRWIHKEDERTPSLWVLDQNGKIVAKFKEQ
jgi:hypothetical protein